jgi:hypothetical protein
MNTTMIHAVNIWNAHGQYLHGLIDPDRFDPALHAPLENPFRRIWKKLMRDFSKQVVDISLPWEEEDNEVEEKSQVRRESQGMEGGFWEIYG